MTRASTATNLAPRSALPSVVDPARALEREPRDAGWSVVVPTLGRLSLGLLLHSLAEQRHLPDDVVVVDDRPDGGADLDVDLPVIDVERAAGRRPVVHVVRGHGQGPAHARNLGWQTCRGSWVVFVDDDVVLPPDWSDRLMHDLADANERVGGVQARIDVPLPAGRRPTDWERGTAGLSTARWATAEMAYRREALVEVGGFDERFPRAYREDADLALRVRLAGFELVRGDRHITHPVRASSTWASLKQQRGNRDDALMRRLHGAAWRSDADCPAGRLRWHAVTSAALVGSVLAAASGHRRAAWAATAAWAALTLDFTLRRTVPGPRTAGEVARMAATSASIPPYAVLQRLLGTLAHRRAAAWTTPVRAVLFDRDGTLVEDVPYNGDPEQVRPVAGARKGVNRLRANGIAIGVVTNQSGIARGLVSRSQADAVNRRIDQLVGPFDTWQVCPHGPDDACVCRKPGPGLVLAAAKALGVSPHELVVVGDIGTDVEAATAAGARGVLVPNGRTLPAEVKRARHVAATLDDAVTFVLDGAA